MHLSALFYLIQSKTKKGRNFFRPSVPVFKWSTEYAFEYSWPYQDQALSEFLESR